MANTNILARYGIKEVADVTFYELNENGKPTHPVLYLDTLKVSTIEQTGEETQATGGKGNAPLIAWDYGKDITVTLEDALFSAKSMAIMFSNGSVKDYKSAQGATDENKAYIMRTEQFTTPDFGTTEQGAAITQTVAEKPQGSNVYKPSVETDLTSNNETYWKINYEAPNGRRYLKKNPKFYNALGVVVNQLESNTPYFCTYDLEVSGAVIDISSNSFPGTYYVTGDTYARSEASGKDEFFQFIIPKAKVQSENTITMEAEGDPSVFNMNLHVLRPADGIMMKLVKYDLEGGSDATGSSATNIIHNHALDIYQDPTNG